MVLTFVKAILIGLCATIPLGPLGILVIQNTLSKGQRSGFSVGCGSPLGDLIFAAVALLSVSAVSDFLGRNRIWVMIIGGIIVGLIGLQIAIKSPIKDIRQGTNRATAGTRYIQDALRGFLMTVANPGALVLMIGIFAFFGVGVTPEHPAYTAAVILAGVLIGILSWWFCLSTVISIFRKRFRLRQLITINRIAGIAIAAIGFLSLFDGVIQCLINK